MSDAKLLGGAGTPRSNVLYASIVATVAATTDRRLTVREIAARLEADVDATAQCIALHRYLRSHALDAFAGTLPVPLPGDFAIPAIDDLIDESGLGLDGAPSPKAA